MTTTDTAGVAQQRPRRTTPKGPLTWLGHPWRNDHWSHPVLGTGAAYALGGIADKVHAPTWAGIAVPILGTAAGFLMTAGEKFPDAARAYFTTAGLALGGLVAWETATTPYSWVSTMATLGLGAIYTAAYPGVRHAQTTWEHRYRARRSKPGEQPTTAPEPAPQPRGEAGRWQALFNQVDLRDLVFVDRIENRAGFAVRAALPVSGKVTFNKVFGAAERIEIATRMPEGSIRVERATDEHGRTLAGEVLIHFDVRDILSEMVILPDDHTPLSINNAFPIGVYTDGQPIYLTLREVAALVVGVRGRGKTNLLNVLIYQLSRCVDVVIWMIDLKGGRAAKPWLQPWLAGKARRPVLDWVATTRQEAHLMLLAAKGIIEQRGRDGAGGSKITPSRDMPAVMVICDEVAALVGRHAGPRTSREGQGATSHELAGILTSCIQLGRSEAVDFVLATQRATVTMTGSGDLKSQCELRIGLGVTSPSDARSVFQGDAVAAKLLDKLKGKATRGAVLVQEGEDRVLPGKGFFVADERVPEAAILHQDLPAPLNKASAAAAEKAVRAFERGEHGYSDRWSEARAAHLYSNDLAPEVTDAELDEAEEQARNADAPLPAQHTTAQLGNSGSLEGGNRFFPARSRAEQQSAAQKVEVSDDEWAAMVDLIESEEVAEEPTGRQDDADAYARMVDIVRAAGRSGIKGAQVVAKLAEAGISPEHRSTVYRWLKKAEEDGLVKKPSGTRLGSYYTPENV